jgi:cell division protein ZapE
VRLLAFDEFHVSDIADAMILGRLLEKLIEKGVVIVLTSNYKPDDLYPEWLAARAFLPADPRAEREPGCVEPRAGERITRRRLLDALKVYYSPIDDHADANLARFFEAMTKATYTENGSIEIGNRRWRTGAGRRA